MTDDENKSLTVDGVEYPLADFSDEQRYLLTQVQDLSGKVGNLRFQMDQAEVAKQFFIEKLASSLKSEEESDGVAGADIAD